MTDLYMIRADIEVRKFQRWMGSRRLQDADHAMHCLLTECFGPDLAPRPFRAIFPRGGAMGTLYGYGTADADALRDAVGTYACPLQSQIIPVDRLDGKRMPGEWPAGKRLGFEVRIRPIVRRTRQAYSRPGKEYDAFQIEADQYPKGAMPRSREEVYRDWLGSRFDTRGGAKLESVSMQSFQRIRAYRKRNAARYSEGPDALMRGVLTVDDGAAFSKLLADGVGRHRAYGYGMLLLRPAGSSVGR